MLPATPSKRSKSAIYIENLTVAPHKPKISFLNWEINVVATSKWLSPFLSALDFSNSHKRSTFFNANWLYKYMGWYQRIQVCLHKIDARYEIRLCISKLHCKLTNLHFQCRSLLGNCIVSINHGTCSKLLDYSSWRKFLVYTLD